MKKESVNHFIQALEFPYHSNETLGR